MASQELRYPENTFLLFTELWTGRKLHIIPLYRETEGFKEQQTTRWKDIIIQSGIPEFRVVVQVITKKPANEKIQE